jgi:geranylgeranyl pyrophosphate synthase
MLTCSTEKLLTLFTGQSFDLHWTYNTTCPSISQYLQMIDSSKLTSLFVEDFTDGHTETGALFQLLSRLMLINATTRTHVHLDTLSTLFGRFFQIRDDYQNLVSADVCSIPSLTFCSQFVVPV